jgi:transcription elongation factor GreA
MATEASGNAAQIMLTREGMRKLEEELEDLKVHKRLEVADRIKTAIAFGDLSENAEYDAAKTQQAFIEGRIRDIEQMLRQAHVVEEHEVGLDAVGVGNAVRVYDMEYSEEDEYTIVGSTEADPKKLHISNESPIGRALLGKRVGDIVEVQAPGGAIKLKILEIRKR